MNILLKFLRKDLCKRLPDRLYLQLVYIARMQKNLRLKNPKSFNEKLQWLKLYDRQDQYTIMVDKIRAKHYVSEKIGAQAIIPTLGVWDTFDEIDFNKLPNQFVLKCSHDSGGIVICRDKSKLDMDAARRKITRALQKDYYLFNREWPYKNVPRKVFAEEYLEQVDLAGLMDYKFYCFNGEPKFLYVSKGLENHNTASVLFLSMDWQPVPFGRADYKEMEQVPEKPSRLLEMIEIARTLSKGIAFLRVDLYQIGENIKFSELTFTPCGGYMPFEPKQWDIKVGEMLELPKEKKE